MLFGICQNSYKKTFLLYDIFVKCLDTAFEISAIMFAGWSDYL